MTKKTRRKQKPYDNIPNKCCVVGSSNNLKVKQLGQFHLPVENLSIRGAHTGTYLKQLLPLKSRCVTILMLSFNNVLRYEHQIGNLRENFCRQVQICLQTLKKYKLNLRKKLIICLPPLRLSKRIWDQQRIVVRDLQRILDELGIYYFNPIDYVNPNNFLKRDQVHYLPYAEKIISEQTAWHLKNFMSIRWDTPRSKLQ